MPRESFEILPVKHNAPIPMASRVGNILYTSGIMGADPDSGRLPEAIEEQAENCFRNLANVLARAGARPEEVVKVTVYIKSNNTRQAVNPAWLKMFPDEHSRPASHQTVV
jgi:2-iminobutanoate/2-iminopropanoate deaminase